MLNKLLYKHASKIGRIDRIFLNIERILKQILGNKFVTVICIFVLNLFCLMLNKLAA